MGRGEVIIQIKQSCPGFDNAEGRLLHLLYYSLDLREPCCAAWLRAVPTLWEPQGAERCPVRLPVPPVLSPLAPSSSVPFLLQAQVLPLQNWADLSLVSLGKQEEEEEK